MQNTSQYYSMQVHIARCCLAYKVVFRQNLHNNMQYIYICDGVWTTCVVQMYVHLFLECVWCVCDVLYLISSRHIEGLLRSHWSYVTWLLSCRVSKLLLFVVSLENIVYIGYMCIEYLFSKHPSWIVYILVLLYDHSVNYSIILVIDARVMLMKSLFWNKFELLSCFVGNSCTGWEII